MPDLDIDSVILIGLDGLPYEAGGSSGGASQADNSAFTAGTDSGSPLEGLYEATPSTITDGHVGVVGITANRVVKAGLHAADGTAITTLPVSLASVPSHAVTNAGTFAVQAAGDVAAGSSDSGNPVKVGGKYNSTQPTLTDGQRGDLQLDTRGQAIVIPVGIAQSAADNTSNTLHYIAASAAPASGRPLATASFVFDGSTWDRAPGDSTNGLDVDVTRIIPGTGATNLGKAEDAAHASGDVGVMALAVRAASPTERSAGPTDGDYEPLSVNEVGAQWVSLTPSMNGGLSTFMASGSDGSSILVATAQAAKASAGNLYGYYVFNPEAATTFLHFYNTAQGSVTVGTTNPLMSFAVPAGAAANLSFPMGVAFSTAITVAATTTAGGNTAPGTGLSLVAWYK